MRWEVHGRSKTGFSLVLGTWTLVFVIALFVITGKSVKPWQHWSRASSIASYWTNAFLVRAAAHELAIS